MKTLGRKACRGLIPVVLITAWMGIARPALGQSTQPARDVEQSQVLSSGSNGNAASGTAPDSAIEQREIRRNDPARASQQEASDKRRETRTSAGGANVTSGLDARRVVIALAVVVGLIVVVRVAFRYLFPGMATARSSDAVRVVSRSVLSPKQQVLLLQVGRRLIVVGDSGTQMQPLAQIEDADEVASLLGQLQTDKAPSAARRSFGVSFLRARKPFDELTISSDLNRDVAPAVANDEDEQVEESTSRISSANAAFSEPIGLDSARGELKSLIERVKDLSQQFRRS